MAEPGWQERLAKFDPRPRKKSYHWIPFFLVGVGLLIAPYISGWAGSIDQLGIAAWLVNLLGILFLACASFLHTLHGLKLRAQELEESVDAANAALYGKNWKAERNAVEILIGCLEGPGEELQKKARENLRTLTGQDFGLDPQAWRTWWSENRVNFRKASRS